MRQAQLHLDELDPASLLEKIRSWGVDVVGIGDVGVGLPSDLTGLSTAISLALFHPTQSQPDEDLVYEHRYAEIDQKLEYIQERISRQLRVDGWRFLKIPADSYKQQDRMISKVYPLFPHKTAATCAGLGWVGKSGLLINPLYGPRLSWATVLTNAPYRVTGKPYVLGQCGKCSACVRACPNGAISGREWMRGTHYETMVDITACAQQLDKNLNNYGVQACGNCISACWRGKE